MAIKHHVIVDEVTAPPSTTAIDAALASALIDSVGKPLKTVKLLFAKLGLPLSIDGGTFGIPTIGLTIVARSAASAAGAAAIARVEFHAAKEPLLVRGTPRSHTFKAFPHPLLGITMGSSRAAVTKAWGKPSVVVKTASYWHTSATREIRVQFGRTDKAQSIAFCVAHPEAPPATPPFSGPRY